MAHQKDVRCNKDLDAGTNIELPCCRVDNATLFWKLQDTSLDFSNPELAK